MSRAVPDFISTYLEYTATHEGSEMIHKWAAIAVMSACLERRVWLKIPQIGYVYPNVYVFIVGPPAVRKSSSARRAVSLLRGVQGGPTFVQEQLTPPVLTETAFDALRFTENGSGQEVPHSPVFGFAEELSTFLKDIGGGSLLDLLMKFYDETDDPTTNLFERKTISRGSVSIQNPSVSLLGCTTPKFISKVIPGDAVGEGFASRVIFVVEYKNKFSSAYPKAPDSTLRKKLTDTLSHIYQLQGPFTETPEARKFFIPWYNHEQEKAVMETDEFRSTYLARKGTHAWKIAQIISASRSDDRIITERDYVLASTWLNELEKTMFTAFTGRMNDLSTEEILTAILMNTPKEPTWISHGDLLKKFSILDTDFRKYVQTLIQMGAVEFEVRESSKLFYRRKRNFTPDVGLRRIEAIERKLRNGKSIA